MTAADLGGVPDGGTLEVPGDAELTALAREEAERRGLRIRALRSGASERMRIAVAADGGGYSLKRDVLAWVSEMGHATLDLGTRDQRPADCAELARAVGTAVARGQCALGIVIDDTGVGSAIAANRVPGARAASCSDAAMARLARTKARANVLAIGAEGLARIHAYEIVRAFLGGEPPEPAELERGLGAAASLRVAPASRTRAACRPPDPGHLASYIEHTLLRADATLEEIDRLCAEALEHRFAGVCVNGVHVQRCAEILRGSGVLVVSVAGFPLGAMASEVKVQEARRAVQDGACEVDMVMAIGLFRSGADELVEGDIAGVVLACHALGARVKVILETCLLTRDEKVRACRIARSAGADFVKTSTGFASGGASVEDVALMRETVGPAMGVKASGGVRDRESALALVAAGATRIGTSRSVAIVSR